MRDLAVGVAAVVVLVVTLVGLRRCLVRRMADRTLRSLDQLQSRLTHWDLGHRARMRDLQQRMTDVEEAVARAGDDARLAATAMAQIRGDLLQRIQRVEQQSEIETLVADGRIPAEHLPPARPTTE